MRRKRRPRIAPRKPGHSAPPSGVGEGQLSASYDWSVSSVQFKGAQADTFGSPLIAGYWQVSTSCSVTVTDTTTNQYWSGSAGAGPEDLISATLTRNPSTDTSVFLNTKNYVVVAVAPRTR